MINVYNLFPPIPNFWPMKSPTLICLFAYESLRVGSLLCLQGCFCAPGFPSSLKSNHSTLLYINSQSRFFLVFYWSRAYHVRVTKLGCLPRNSARGRQYVIDRQITKKNHVRHHVKMRPLDMPKSARFVSYLSNCVY